MGSPPNGKNNGATIGFEAKLWQAADKLRNNMDAAEYKHVVFGLIFLKYISDSFEEMHNRLASGEADYEGANPEDQDEYRAENVFWVPIDLSVTSERVLSGRALMFGTAGSHRTVEDGVRGSSEHSIPFNSSESRSTGVPLLTPRAL